MSHANALTKRVAARVASLALLLAVACGAGDTQLGLQVVLEHESASRPGVALAYYVKLPTADAGLGTGRTDHNLLALLSKKEGETVFDFNAVYLLAGRTTEAGRASSR